MGQKITHIGGNALGSTYAAWIGAGSGYGLPQTYAQTTNRTGEWPLFSALQRSRRSFNLHVVILGGGGDTERTNLFTWLDPEGETTVQIRATDEDGTTDPRYLDVICEDCRPAVNGDKSDLWHFIATCVEADGDPRWRKVTADTQSWSVTSDGDTEVVANGGEDDAYPILKIKPTTAVGGGGTANYRSWVPISWKAEKAGTSYPFKIGAWDTESLIHTATATTLDGNLTDVATTVSVVDASSFPTAGMAYITDVAPGDEQISYTGKSGNDLTGVTRGIGGTSGLAHTSGDAIVVSKMMDNGDDIRLINNGVEIDYWIVDIDNASTYIWCNLDFSAAQSATLATAIGSGDTITTIDGDDISGFPSTGILLIDSEAFVYTGKNGIDNQFTGVTRAAKETTAADHTTSDTIYWIQNDLWLTYDDYTASAPTIDDDYQPILKDTSTNASWIYEEFGENDLLRTGAWVRPYAGASMYTANRGTTANPWEEIGIGFDGVGTLYFSIYNPCEITNANFTNGEKWADDTGDWGDNDNWAGIQSDVSGSGGWTNEYEITAPTVDNTWEAWSRDEAITAGMYYVRLVNSITPFSAVGDGLFVEAADCTLTLNATYAPAHTVNAEADNQYDLDCTITNNTTSKSISLVYPGMNLDDELEVDTYAKTVTDLSDDSSQMQAITIDSGPRRHWLALDPGNNTLQYDETGVTAVTVALEWTERHYS